MIALCRQPPVSSCKRTINKINYVLSNTTSVKSFCCRKYNNFIVRCRVPNFHYHGNKRQSMANFSDNVPQRPTVWCMILHYISFISLVKGNFLLIFLNFRYRGNKCRSGVNFNDTVKLLNFKKLPCLMPCHDSVSKLSYS